MTPREFAKRIERGEKWKLADEPAPCQSQNAERLAEALRMCMDIMLEHGVPTHPDTDARVAYTAAEQALAAHSAQAQPPAASVPGVSAQAHENAQAALGAQENPNG